MRTKTEATTTNEAAVVAATGAAAAPQTTTTKKGASLKEGSPKGEKAAKKPAAKARKMAAKEASAPREGTKTAQVVAMLQRKSGASISEIMKRMSWQRHTVRGFMAGAMKKAGFAVESFKPEDGQRTYRLNA
jgi:hypothetical protein